LEKFVIFLKVALFDFFVMIWLHTIFNLWKKPSYGARDCTGSLLLLYTQNGGYLCN